METELPIDIRVNGHYCCYTLMEESNMDRQPLPPPFPVGTKVRYLGTMQTWADPEGKVKLQYPGIEVEVTEVKQGRQGTGRLIEVDEFSGDEIRDTTRDGYSVWMRADGNGRIIWPADAHDWEII